MSTRRPTVIGKKKANIQTNGCEKRRKMQTSILRPKTLDLGFVRSRLTLNHHLMFDIPSCHHLHHLKLPASSIVESLSTSIDAAIILHCSHHQLQLRPTNINTDIIGSSMEMLTYLSASSIQLTLDLSTYGALS